MGSKETSPTNAEASKKDEGVVKAPELAPMKAHHADDGESGDEVVDAEEDMVIY